MGESIDKHVLAKYDVLSKLGKGVRVGRWAGAPLGSSPERQPPQAYGIVWKAVDRRTGDTVALKKIFDAFQNATDAQARHRACKARAARLARRRCRPAHCWPSTCKQ